MKCDKREIFEKAVLLMEPIGEPGHLFIVEKGYLSRFRVSPDKTDPEKLKIMSLHGVKPRKRIEKKSPLFKSLHKVMAPDTEA